MRTSRRHSRGSCAFIPEGAPPPPHKGTPRRHAGHVQRGTRGLCVARLWGFLEPKPQSPRAGGVGSSSGPSGRIPGRVHGQQDAGPLSREQNVYQDSPAAGALWSAGARNNYLQPGTPGQPEATWAEVPRSVRPHPAWSWGTVPGADRCCPCQGHPGRQGRLLCSGSCFSECASSKPASQLSPEVAQNAPALCVTSACLRLSAACMPFVFYSKSPFAVKARG